MIHVNSLFRHGTKQDDEELAPRTKTKAVAKPRQKMLIKFKIQEQRTASQTVSQSQLSHTNRELQIIYVREGP